MYASGETYSAYFTDAKLYLDVTVTGSGASKTVNASPTAFERFNYTPESVYYGRDASGGSLYNNGDGRNQVIYETNGSPATSPHLDRTNKTVGSSDYINY